MKQLKGFIVGVLVTLLLLNGVGFAQGVQKSIEVVLNSINVQVNGNKVNTPNISYDGTTYVPLRKISEMLGKEVIWDGGTNTVNIVDNNIDATALPSEAEIGNEKMKDFDTVVKIKNDLYRVDIDFYTDKAGHYYTEVESLAGLIAISYNDYKVGSTADTTVKGILQPDSKRYYTLESKYLVNQTYYAGAYYNRDRSKEYKISNIPHEEVGVTTKYGRMISPVNSVFSSLELQNVYFEKDDAKKQIVISFN